MSEDKDMPTSIHHIRGSVVLLSLRVIGALFLVDTFFAAALAIAAFTVGSDYYNFVIASLWLLHTVKFLVEVYLVLNLIIPWTSTTYYMTDHQLIKSSGVLKLNEKTYELNQLRSIDLSESWLGRILNYGTIHGTVSGSGYSDEFRLVGIGEAKKYERIIKQHLTSQ